MTSMPRTSTRRERGSTDHVILRDYSSLKSSAVLRQFGTTLAAGTLMTIALLSQGSAAHAQVSSFSSFILNKNDTTSGATATATALTLTDGGSNEARSGFSSSLVNYGNGFTASYTYKTSGGGVTPADGIAFMLQNDARGTAAVGASGASLGYGGTGSISNSAAVEFDIFLTNGVGTAFATNGATGGYAGTGLVNIASGNPISVMLTYSSSTSKLTETLTDTVTNAAYTTNYTTNLSTVGGGGKAYVGFSGGTGSSTSTQVVSNFTFTGAAAPEPGSIALLALGAIGMVGAAVGKLARRRLS